MNWLRQLLSWPHIGNFRALTGPAALSQEDRETVERFSALYYRLWLEGRGTIDIGWLGYKTLKCPTDLWTYQEILSENPVDWIVECGTRFGGSAYFLANICELLGRGRVVSIDVEEKSVDVDGTVRKRPTHPRIEYLLGSSTDPKTVERVASRIKPSDTVMAILDSDHRRDHVLAEMRCYAPLVTPGCYLIVEDTNLNGHPAFPDFGPGPWEAVDTFLAENADFTVDAARERFLLTLNPRGYLRKIR